MQSTTQMIKVNGHLRIINSNHIADRDLLFLFYNLKLQPTFYTTDRPQEVHFEILNLLN